MRDKQRLKEYNSKRYAACKESGICPQCKEAPARPGKVVCTRCQQKQKGYHTDRYGRAKDAIFAVYGTFCACCGERDRRFLTIDHIEGNGAQHRKELGSKPLAYWLVEQGFPDGYQILCWNCNSGREINGGICPHKDNYNA